MDNLNVEQLIKILEDRFQSNNKRHINIKWEDVLKKILISDKIVTLMQMEETGGEPDVIKYDEIKNKYIFCDCSTESPIGRRSLCYDDNALESRKNFKPVGSAMNLSNSIGIRILNEEEYLYLQTLGDFDNKSTSWIATPNEIRSLGGSLFGDKRYGRTFIYHNGAESYYSSRGFRGIVEI